MKQRDDTNKRSRPAATDTQRQSRYLLKFICRLPELFSHLRMFSTHAWNVVAYNGLIDLDDETRAWLKNNALDIGVVRDGTRKTISGCKKTFL